MDFDRKKKIWRNQKQPKTEAETTVPKKLDPSSPFTINCEKRLKHHNHQVGCVKVINIPISDDDDDDDNNNSKKKRYLVSCSKDKKIRFWDMMYECLDENLEIEHSHQVHFFVFYKDKYMIFTSSGGWITIYELLERKFHEFCIFKSFKICEKGGLISKFVIYEDKYMFSMIESYGTIMKTDMSDFLVKDEEKNRCGNKEKTTEVYKHGRSTLLGYIVKSKTKKDIAIFGGKGPNILVKLDMNTLECEKFEEKHRMELQAIATYKTKDRNERILCSGYGGKVTIWKLDGTFISEVKTNAAIRCVLQVNRDHFLMGDYYGNIYSLNLNTLEVKKEARNHSDRINSFCILSKKGGFIKIATSSRDYHVAIYQSFEVGIDPEDMKDDVDLKDRIDFVFKNWSNSSISLSSSKFDVVKLFLL